MLISTNKQTATYVKGLQGEWLAAWALRVRGWRILARRWSCRLGEVDLIARRGRLVIFVEVKARRDIETALAYLTERQWQRIEATADIFLARHNELQDGSWRFDAVCITPYQWPRHFPAIWHP